MVGDGMKRCLKLVIIIALVFVSSVSAKTYDFYNGHIEYDIYKSGDIITNFITYVPGIVIKNPMGYLLYNEDGTINRSGNDIYDIAGNTFDTVRIPKMYGKTTYWQYYAEEYDDNYGWMDIDIFKPIVIEPDYSIVCDKEYVEYGENANCTLKSTSIKYMRDVIAYLQLVKFNSEDFNIENVETLNYWKYDNNKKAYYFDINEFDRDFDETGYDLMTSVEGFTNSVVELDESGNIVNKSLVNYDDEDYNRDTDQHIYSEEFDILRFTINPKEEGLDIRSIKLQSSINTGYTQTEEETKVVTFVKPLKEEVKGVEEVTENPKTGLLNYVLLLIPILLFINAYKSILNKETFKYSK